jgi:AcrR family transcriptional regulator
MTKQPAHRPSRRNELVSAAIQVFAEKGFAEASLGDIAQRADVALTAVYYHFAGKDDLFAAAMRSCLSAISEVVIAARPAGKVGIDSLDATIDAVWDWIDENPYSAALVHVQLPGAIRQVASIRQEFLELHEMRALDFFDAGDLGRTNGSRTAASILRVRALIDVLMAVHAMRLADGPLSTASPDAVRSELHRVARKLLTTT